MILAWRICFSALFALPALASTVRGSILLAGSNDPAVRKHHDYSGVVVWLKPLNGTVVPAGLVREHHAKMIQKDKKFIPHVLAIPVNSTVSFPNLDPIFHNAFSNFNGQIFDIGLYPPGRTRTQVFQREGIVRVFCNIHPQMSAVIVVLATPYFAITTATGAFEITNVAAGDYELHLFHERADPEQLQSLERKVKVDAVNLDLPVVSISESGFVQVPHKNKYGKDYAPVIDQPGYGAKQ